MFRFTIRDVLWLMVVVGLACALGMQLRQAEFLRESWHDERSRNLEFTLGTHPYFDVIEMPLKDVAQYFSDLHGFECRLADGVDGDTPISGNFPDKPWSVIFDEVLSPHGLDYRRDGIAIVIYKRSTMARPTRPTLQCVHNPEVRP